MPLRPVLSPQHRSLLEGRQPVKQPLVSKHRDQQAIRQRGLEVLWLPTGAHEQISSVTGQTVALAGRVDRPQTLVPPRNASGAVLMMVVAANTATTGIARLNLYADRSGSVLLDVIASLTCSMVNASNSSRCQAFAPLVDGGIFWDTTVTGTVNYDVSIYVVGFLLE